MRMYSHRPPSDMAYLFSGMSPDLNVPEFPEKKRYIRDIVMTEFALVFPCMCLSASMSSVFPVHPNPSQVPAFFSTCGEGGPSRSAGFPIPVRMAAAELFGRTFVRLHFVGVVTRA